jgi:hypothetical protein
MPVQKFKSFQEAKEDLYVLKPDKDYPKFLFEFFELQGKLFTKKFPHGVFKFHTLQEAQQQKDNWLLETTPDH